MGAAAVLAGQRITASLLNSLPVSVPMATGSIASSVAEAVIGTFTFPANDPAAAAGSGYRFHVFGTADDTGTPTLTLRVRAGGLAGTIITAGLGPTACQATVTNMKWAMDIWGYYSAAGAGGTLDFNGNVNEQVFQATWTAHPVLGLNIAMDTTATVTFVVTAQWGTSSASNICRTLTGAAYRI